MEIKGFYYERKLARSDSRKEQFLVKNKKNTVDKSHVALFWARQLFSIPRKFSIRLPNNQQKHSEWRRVKVLIAFQAVERFRRCRGTQNKEFDKPLDNNPKKFS